jgi:predicted DNA-binding transcriptional regulator AlpA
MHCDAAQLHGNKEWLCRSGAGNPMYEIRNLDEQRTIQLVVNRDDLKELVQEAVSQVIARFEQERKAQEEAKHDAKILRSVASERLNKDLSTLYRWEKAGMLHPIKIGRSVYYRESEIKGIEEGRL